MPDPIVRGSGGSPSAGLPRALVVVDFSASGGDAGLSLMPVANRPLVLRTLDSLAKAGVRDVTLSVEPALLPRVARVLDGGAAWPFELSCMGLSLTNGLIGAIRSARRSGAPSPILLHWACALFNAPLASLLDGVTVGALDAVVLVGTRHAESPVVDLASERLAAAAGLPRSKAAGLLAGVAVLGSAAPEVARDVESGRDGDADLLTLVERMAEVGGRVGVQQVAGCWRHAGGVDTALEANRFLLAALPDRSRRFDGGGTVVEGPAAIDDSATLQRCTLRGPVIVGPRARVVDAYIGPYTSIAADACIEGAEIENSIILDASRICHLGRRLEASVVGPNATVSRDFRLPRAMRLRVGEDARISLP
jgi:glucose-1-phosphate thymidylyltransferase